jgi:hypothetical protein
MDKEVYFWVWSEFTDKRGRRRTYSRTFPTIEEGRREYDKQIKKGRFSALYKRIKYVDGAGCADRLACNW